MPPKQRVDLDLDALAPPNVTVRLRGNVYSLPGEIPIDTVVRALQLQDKLGDDEESNIQAIEALSEIIHDLFRSENEGYEPVPLTLSAIMNILGLVLSGMEIDFEEAVKEAIAGIEEESDQKAEDADDPPTSRKPSGQKRSRSAERSPVAS